MVINFRKIDRLRSGSIKGGKSEKAHETDLPLDHQLTFNYDSCEKWHYKNGHIFVNDEDADNLINRNQNDISLLTGLSSALDIYKNYVWNKGGGSHDKFNAAINSLQGKIVGRLGSIYEGIIGGVRYEFSGEVLWINNVNIKAVIALYRLRPTEKARSYLKGLRDKLFLIIARQQSNPRVNGVHEVVHSIIDEIEVVLKSCAPSDTRLLVADTGAQC